MNKKENIRYFESYTDDFVESKEQEFKLPEDYKWIKQDLFSRFISALVYAVALIVSTVYCRLFLHVRFKNAKILRQTLKTGGFIFGNHTQPIGDVFDPALACFPNRIYTIVSPANLGIPVIGKILPYLGALPIPDTVSGMKRLNEAIEHRLNQNKCIVIYPEAHVWEYCADIRPFSEASFKYPIKFSKPSYSMTATYQKRRLGKKPKITIYFDGPFMPCDNGSLKEKTASLHNQVYDCMVDRSKNSNIKYIDYRKKM